MTTENIVHVNELEIGTRLEKNAFDSNNIMLVGAGTVVTEELLDQLRIRGVRKIKLSNLRKWSPQRTEKQQSESDSETVVCSERIVRLDHLADAASFTQPKPVRDSSRTGHLKLADLRDQVQEGTQHLKANVDEYANMVTDLIAGKGADAKAAKNLLGKFHSMITLDPALGYLVADMKSNPTEYLFQHGMNMALITMSTAKYMGYSSQQVFDAGVAALFSDVGMLQVPREIRFADRKLTQGEWLQIEQHPIHTANILEQISSISQHTLLAAYQAHERCDGTGYPRHRRQRNIHPLARVVGIADTYAAMTCLRPHRTTANHPYVAMEAILKERTSLDRDVARSFLNAMSLFPVDCQVQLSNKMHAKVLRANHSLHTRPVVIPLNTDGTESDIEIDLSKDSSIDIIGIVETTSEPAPQEVEPAIKIETTAAA